MKEKIEYLMKLNNMSFHQLASHFTVSKQTMTKKINGTLDWTFDEIILLTKIFHIDNPGEFFNS